MVFGILFIYGNDLRYLVQYRTSLCVLLVRHGVRHRVRAQQRHGAHVLFWSLHIRSPFINLWCLFQGSNLVVTVQGGYLFLPLAV